MADNLLYAEPGGGGNKLVATDEIGGVHFSRFKLIDGTPESVVAAVVDAVYGLASDIKRVAPELLTSLGYGQLTSLSLAVALSTITVNSVVGIPAGAKYAALQAETKDVRYRCDNTSPTAGVGTVIAAGDTVMLALNNFALVRVIETSASAKLNVEFFS